MNSVFGYTSRGLVHWAYGHRHIPAIVADFCDFSASWDGDLDHEDVTTIATAIAEAIA